MGRDGVVVMPWEEECNTSGCDGVEINAMVFGEMDLRVRTWTVKNDGRTSLDQKAAGLIRFASCASTPSGVR